MCNVCQANTVPHTFQKMTMCVQSSMVKELTSNAFVHDCVRYSATAPYCLECVAGTYLHYDSSDKAICVNQCGLLKTGTTVYIAVVDNLDGKANYCVKLASTETNFDTLGFANCLLMERTSTKFQGTDPTSTIKDYNCIKVKEDFYPLFSIDSPGYQGALQPFIESTIYKDSERPQVFNYFGFHIMGLDKTSADIKRVSAANCDLFVLYSSNNYQCFRCTFGLFGLTRQTTDGSNFFFKCVSFNGDCNSSVTYGGFPSHLNAILSCHQCTPSNFGEERFPVIFA